ncbi:hypothetical protein VTK56DRAFT_8396 [Thermocarpiscus australiensis]
MATAVALFFGLPELLSCLAEQIRSRKQLATLRLVSNAFKAAATPFLFREFVIYGTQIWPFPARVHLGYVRTLELAPSLLIGPRDRNALVQKILPMVPRLESFETSGIPLTIDSLKVLHDSCKSIKSLRVRFPSDMERSILDSEYPPWQMESPELHVRPEISIFTGLEELTLHNLYNDLPWWRSQIVQVLRNSPGLRKLHLCISYATIEMKYEQDQPEAYLNFFDRLCDEYGETGSAPLHLRSLRCGRAIYPYELSSLQKLTDLVYLEEVQITNEGVTLVDTDFDVMELYASGERSGIAFEAFGPAHAPNLRRFSAHRYRGDVHNFLCSIKDPLFARQLAISFARQGPSCCCCRKDGHLVTELLRPSPKYPSLPLHFRMVDIELQDGLGEDVPVEKVLEDLVSNDAGAIEGLCVHLPENPTAECGFDHLDLLERALPRLVNLTQLYLAFFDEEAEEPPEEAVRRTVERLAIAGPRIRYVKAYWFNFFRIWRSGDGTIRLEELDFEETFNVELFRHCIYSP